MDTIVKNRIPSLDGQKTEVLYDYKETVLRVKNGKDTIYVFQKRDSNQYLRYKKDIVEIVSIDNGVEKPVFSIKLRKINNKLRYKIVEEIAGTEHLFKLLTPDCFNLQHAYEDLFDVKFSKDDKGRFIFDIDDEEKRGEYVRFYENWQEYYQIWSRASCVDKDVDENTIVTKYIDMNIKYLTILYDETFYYAMYAFASMYNIDLDREYLTKSFFIAFVHMVYDYVDKNHDIDAYIRQILTDPYLQNKPTFIDDNIKTMYLHITYNGKVYANEIGATFMFSPISFDFAVAGRIHDLHTHAAPTAVFIFKKNNKIYRYIDYGL